MSDIVTMNETVGDYLSGEVYRVRTRKAQEFAEQDIAVIEPITRLEYDPNDEVLHEGV